MKKACVLSYPLSTQGRLWSDWADAQADRVFAGRTVILLVLLCSCSIKCYDLPPKMTIFNTVIPILMHFLFHFCLSYCTLLHWVQRKTRRHPMTNDVMLWRKVSNKYTVANFWCYPIRRRFIFARALEYCIFSAKKKVNLKETCKSEVNLIEIAYNTTRENATIPQYMYNIYIYLTDMSY